MKRKPRIIEVVIPQVPDPVVMAAHLSSPSSMPVPPVIPASVRLARAREDALRVGARIESTPLFDGVVAEQGWNPST